ncbi:hypothetical protein AVEN_131831-1 [Araneus ventricosus]|uniref:Uncharacterized protein n=1 Tax=Araneus ventricosus TaxID=182803 RepID=A0A4Y2NLM8_ARAVE|nr:hypothetical protein AVEN_131831-1 [Araneus ventricosus]
MLPCPAGHSEALRRVPIGLSFPSTYFQPHIRDSPGSMWISNSNLSPDLTVLEKFCYLEQLPRGMTSGAWGGVNASTMDEYQKRQIAFVSVQGLYYNPDL